MFLNRKAWKTTPSSSIVNKWVLEKLTTVQSGWARLCVGVYELTLSRNCTEASSQMKQDGIILYSQDDKFYPQNGFWHEQFIQRYACWQNLMPQWRMKTQQRVYPSLLTTNLFRNCREPSRSTLLISTKSPIMPSSEAGTSS